MATNGFEDGNDYMRVKKLKLAQQNDEIRDALRHRNATSRSEIFKNVSINVNGRTQPTADELKRLILLHGGKYDPYYRYKTTKFMIASNLSLARIKQLRPDDRIIKPQWITDSVQVGCLLPYEDYQIFFEEPRGKTGFVNFATGNQETVAESHSKIYRGEKKQKHLRKDFKPHVQDIRNFFTRAHRTNLTSSPSQHKQ